MNPNINPRGVKNPFRHFCMSIGAIPTSYKESLSYYETLLYLIRYLEDTVIPAIDNNAEALEELQGLFIQLKNYVDNYFDTQDFQEMVNTKLDEMVLDGTLENLINTDLFNGLNTKLNRVIYTKSKLVENIIEGNSQTVLFTGDSITWGQIPNSSNQSEHPYPELIQSFIRNWYSDLTLINCLNYGVKGSNATNANNNINTYLAQNPDTIVWAYGTNDVTQLRSNDTIISDLETFYTSCINNNIELIVIIPAPNFINLARRQGMFRLHQALLNFCKSRGIIYVDMYDYLNNIYNTNATTHDALQTDGTHFVDYTVFRDGFISTLFPICYKQNNNEYNYIQVDSTPNYVQTNIGDVTVVGGVNIFSKALRITSDSGNTFKMNFLVTKPSILYLNGYSNNTAGKGTFTLDGVDYVINQYGDYTGTATTANIYNYEFPIVLQAGIHYIELKSISFELETINRYYIFGFTLKENLKANFINGYRKEDEKILAWSGEETSLTDEPLSIPYNTCNRLSILFGRYKTPGFEIIDIKPTIMGRNFFEDTTYIAPIVWNDTVGILTVVINYSTNQIDISSTNNAPIRKIWLYNE